MNYSTANCLLCCWEDVDSVTSSGAELWPGLQRERLPFCLWSASLEKLPARPCPMSYVLIPPEKHTTQMNMHLCCMWIYNTLLFKNLGSVRFCDVCKVFMLTKAVYICSKIQNYCEILLKYKIKVFSLNIFWWIESSKAQYLFEI